MADGWGAYSPAEVMREGWRDLRMHDEPVEEPGRPTRAEAEAEAARDASAARRNR